MHCISSKVVCTYLGKKKIISRQMNILTEEKIAYYNVVNNNYFFMGKNYALWQHYL